MKNLAPQIHQYCQKLQKQLDACDATPEDVPSDACGTDPDGATYCDTEALVAASQGKSQTQKAQTVIVHVIKSLVAFAKKNNLLQLLIADNYGHGYDFVNPKEYDYDLLDVGSMLSDFQAAYQQYYKVNTQLERKSL